MDQQLFLAFNIISVMVLTIGQQSGGILLVQKNINNERKILVKMCTKNAVFPLLVNFPLQF